jgi:hypothetical protein
MSSWESTRHNNGEGRCLQQVRANCCWRSRRGSRGSTHERGTQRNEGSLREESCQSGIWQGNVHFRKEDGRFRADGG